MDKIDPVDLGCGALIPVRWSKLCAVYRYDHNGLCSPNVVEDKPFKMHVLVQTTRGRWDFHGARGVQDVDDSLLVAGVEGDHFGCRHDRHHADSNLVACFRSGALDPDDEPLFGNQTIATRTLPSLQRALSADSQDIFDSRVFELFDVVSIASLRGTQQRRANRVRMQRVKRFIEERAFEDIGLGDIAACVGLSPFSCLRQFKASTGITPHAYVSHLRMRRARRLLRKSALSIAAVGSAIGIRDQCYFSRWFTKEAGCAPGDFRRDVRFPR